MDKGSPGSFANPMVAQGDQVCFSTNEDVDAYTTDLEFQSKVVRLPNGWSCDYRPNGEEIACVGE